MLEDLRKVIREGDVESFHQRLVEVEEFFQDEDSTVGGLTVSGALCYAARVGSIPMMDTLIQKGVGKVLQDESHTGTYNMNVHVVELYT